MKHETISNFNNGAYNWPLETQCLRPHNGTKTHNTKLSQGLNSLPDSLIFFLHLLVKQIINKTLLSNCVDYTIDISSFDVFKGEI